MAKKGVKRLASEEETAKAFASHVSSWNTTNPGFVKPDDYWEKKQRKALEEGYLNETCSCGVTYLSFHHFTTCSREGCPFSDGVSLLDRIIGDVGNAKKAS